MITLPGFIDPHVHFRTPGQEYKEDFLTGTLAALAGGYTFVIDMPNNLEPITTLSRLNSKIKIAKPQIVSDIGFHFGSLGDNLDEFEKVKDKVFGLKLYLNQTTGGFIINSESLTKIYDAWNIDKPILVHAEEDVIDLVISVCSKTKKKTHICHVSSAEELQKIIIAKKKGLPLTCGVTPHHLFLTSKDTDRLGPIAMMKPTLKSQEDLDFIWKNLKYVDLIESDHAPHTVAEKKSENPPFGVPGLETTLGLLITAVSNNRLTIEEVTRLCHDGPAQIFDVKQNAEIEVDENEEWIVTGRSLKSKSKWSPFEGWKLRGKVKKVWIRNKLVFTDNKILINPGSGKVVKPN